MILQRAERQCGFVKSELSAHTVKGLCVYMTKKRWAAGDFEVGYRLPSVQPINLQP